MITTDQYNEMLARLERNKGRLPETPPDAVEHEADLHDEIIAECRKRGWICFHGSMAHRTKRTIGEPDFVVLADRGRVFFCEGKARSGKLSPEQLGMALWAEKLGHEIHLIHSLKEFVDIVDSGEANEGGRKNY